MHYTLMRAPCSPRRMHTKRRFRCIHNTMAHTKKIFGLIVAGIIALGALGIIIFSQPGGASITDITPSSTATSNVKNTNPTINPGMAASSSTPSSTKQYSLSDVSSHNSASSCWTAISGKVYDLTAWINQHPGGQRAILSICGVDGTQAFLGQHAGQRRPEQELAQFSIGDLIK